MRRPALPLAALALAACSSAPPAGPQFDGTYSGIATRLRDGTVCGPVTQPVIVTVHNGHFSYVLPVAHPFLNWPTENVRVQVQVRQDGSFDGSTAYYADAPLTWLGFRTAWVSVVGHIVGQALKADVESLDCGQSVVANRG
jgi:hypothetical protein